MSEPVWVPAPTSGILHVAGEGYPRRECKDGVRLLCGWVLTKDPAEVERVRDQAQVGRKCVACERWLRLHS